MRGQLYIRLFFAVVPRSPRKGKRRNFYSRYEYFLVLSDAALCVEVLRASTRVPVHRLGNLCKTFFVVLPAEFFIACHLSSVEECVGLRGTCIHVLGVNPE